jgi:hypothetical protein
MSWFSPCPWGDEDGYGMVRKFLHGTGLGNMIVNNLFNVISQEVVNAHGYNEDQEVFKMKPWYSPFWTGSGVGIHNFDTDFHQLIKDGKIRCHIADIQRLEGDKVFLSTGETVGTDIILCATGWKKDATIEYSGVDFKGLGLPISAEEQARLRGEADKQVLEEFPILKNQPVLRYQRTTAEPLRHYRFIVPPELHAKRNFAFAGMVSTVDTAAFANAQALWISAYFDGKLKREPKSQDDMVRNVLLYTQFGKWRYPCGYGDSLPDFAFEALPYVDLLLNDVGLRCHRKATQIAEFTEPYKPWDYKGLTQEYQEMHGQKVVNGVEK